MRQKLRCRVSSVRFDNFSLSFMIWCDWTYIMNLSFYGLLELSYQNHTTIQDRLSICIFLWLERLRHYTHCTFLLMCSCKENHAKLLRCPLLFWWIHVFLRFCHALGRSCLRLYRRMGLQKSCKACFWLYFVCLVWLYRKIAIG